MCCRIVMNKLSSLKDYSSNLPIEALECNLEMKINWNESITNCIMCKLIFYYNIKN